jgi:putative ABC transport system permease protein
MTAFVERSMAATRFAVGLIAAFAAIAAILAAVGLYGVLSTAVRQRTAEIGMRMVFGAPRFSILRLIVGEGLRLSAIGLALGVLAGVGVTGLMRALLVAVSPTDPPTFAAITLLFVGIALAAAWVPAYRASRLEPTVALREE